MLRLRLYDCARLYIVRYRQCLAFGNIYIGDHFSVAREEKRPPKVAQVAVCRRSEHCDVYIGCQHQCCLPRTRDRINPNLGNAPYRLQRVQFVAYRLTIFAVLPR